MIHRLTIPFPTDHDDDGRLQPWLYRVGWAVTEWMEEYDPLHWMPPRRYTLTLRSRATLGELRVSSGVILVYDDIEKSLGVTWLAEPQDAIPPQPEDARPTRG